LKKDTTRTDQELRQEGKYLNSLLSLLKLRGFKDLNNLTLIDLIQNKTQDLEVRAKILETEKKNQEKDIS